MAAFDLYLLVQDIDIAAECHVGTGWVFDTQCLANVDPVNKSNYGYIFRTSIPNSCTCLPRDAVDEGA